ncbi:4-hydroxy-3-methylbut-2-enyl diphosphate reductase [Candidatus Kinetoplastibacterium sorsogonicusi]|uniref:4-hydroxy-3-methylbut-2-enyl diphosphate reductase n=1 Tax=Candidatus Kinetoplastidibacterium kentomonadis TaxID=1576550 RepID=A0A3Q8ERF1_9PROT|nr:4-hydroxy-3-methylbut-2-enyl diphosphate reductase [Candidatus Kinetoplastibacterium sorsogonicusi]AWD32516.1 4-hydroxy-3-methylbut-2-enyl diphosphate reductase [Candidatus Kinetoplastibacterium sorsogonicusi]
MKIQSETEIILANPRGFCAGVERAINIVEKVLTLYNPPIYVKHDIVHNKHVVSYFKSKGVIFIEDLSLVPNEAIIIFSAHGVSKKIKKEAKFRNLKIFDATCPLVTKVHLEVENMRKKNKKIIMIGHKGHPEVEGTLGQCKDGIFLVESFEDIKKLNFNEYENLALITQTTLSIDDTNELSNKIKFRYPNIEEPKKSDICYATQNRQDAIKILTKFCDLIIILGSKNSSNSNRLYEIAIKSKIESYLIDDFSDFKEVWLIDKKKIGISAGASAPENLINDLLDFLCKKGIKKISTINKQDENMSFKLPIELINIGAD